MTKLWYAHTHTHTLKWRSADIWSIRMWFGEGANESSRNDDAVLIFMYSYVGDITICFDWQMEILIRSMLRQCLLCCRLAVSFHCHEHRFYLKSVHIIFRRTRNWILSKFYNLINNKSEFNEWNDFKSRVKKDSSPFFIGSVLSWYSLLNDRITCVQKET